VNAGRAAARVGLKETAEILQHAHRPDELSRTRPARGHGSASPSRQMAGFSRRFRPGSSEQRVPIEDAGASWKPKTRITVASSGGQVIVPPGSSTPPKGIRTCKDCAAVHPGWYRIRNEGACRNPIVRRGAADRLCAGRPLTCGRSGHRTTTGRIQARTGVS